MEDSRNLTPEEIAELRRKSKEDMDIMFEKAKQNPIPKPADPEIGELYSRQEIHDFCGGGIEDYLPHNNLKVVCACLRLDINPEAPEIILVGDGVGIIKWADVFRGQIQFVPVFIKRDNAQWEYIGDYRVKYSSSEDEIIAYHAKKANRDNVVRVLFLEKAK